MPEQVKNYTIEIAAGRLVQLGSRAGDRPTPPRTPRRRSTRSARRSTGACAPTTTTASGLAWSGTSTFVQTLPVPTITTATPFSGATFPALTWTPVDGATGYEVQNVWPDGQRAVTSTVPSAAVSYTKMTGTGHGTVQVRAVFGQRQERLHADSRRRPHDRRAGRHQDAADQQAQQAGADVRLEHEDQRQAVQGAGLAARRASRSRSSTRRRTSRRTRRCSPSRTSSTAASCTGASPWSTPTATSAPSASPRSSRSWRACRCIAGQPPHGVQRGVDGRHCAQRQGQAGQGRGRQAPGAGVQDGDAAGRTGRASSTFSVKPTKTGNLTATATKKLFKVGTAVAPIS